MTAAATQEQARPATPVVRRPGIGIAIDPGRVRWWREKVRAYSREELASRITQLDIIDELTGRRLTLTADAIAKIENPHPGRGRHPKPRSVRALCAGLGCEPSDLAPGADSSGPGPAKRRAEYLAGMAGFARLNGIRYTKPSGGRSYNRPLRDAYAAAIGGAPDAEVAAAVAVARAKFPADDGFPVAAPALPPPDESIGVLGLSTRTHNALIRGELPGGARRPVCTIGELTSRTGAELRDLREIGAKNLREIGDKLRDAGLALREDVAGDASRLAS